LHAQDDLLLAAKLLAARRLHAETAGIPGAIEPFIASYSGIVPRAIVSHSCSRHKYAANVHRHHHDDHDASDHRDDEHIVELVSVPTRFEADVIVAALESRGIKAAAVHSDADGWLPQYARIVGHRVMVFENDLEAARAIVAETNTESESEPS
jgi:Putative prokaryotic signal transducing protein